MSPTEAVVYIPDGIECDDGLHMRRGIAHAERRGYRLLGVLRDWARVLRLEAEGAVVVFARREHAASVSRWDVKREFVGEETCSLVPFKVDGEIVSRTSVMHNEVTAYRSGYADGYLDSATIRSAMRRQGWRG